MRKLGLGLALLAAVALLFLLRFVVGTLVVLAKLGVVLGVALGLVYVVYQLWSGWTRAG